MTAVTVVTEDQPPRSRRSRIAVIVLASIVIFSLQTSMPAQGEVGEPDLVAASAGRTIRIGSTLDGRVTVIPLEVYVARVLAGEGEPRAAEGAQQALAIAIRTYTLKNVDRHARDGFDLCDSTHCQVPRPSTPSSRRAAMATVGQILTYRGSVAEVFYSASCGGQSERAGDVWSGADHPYLVSRKDDVCDDDPEWTADFTLRGVQAALARVGFEGARLENVRVEARTSSGRVARLKLSGLRPDVIGGNEFRLAVGPVNLRSTAFSVDRDGESLRFTGRGFGHGVGMCVIGAGRRAMRGESARAILGQYYPGLDLTPLAAATPSSALTASPPPAAVVSTAVVRPSASGITVVAPRASAVSPSDLEQMAVRAHTDLARTLGISVLPITIRLHDSLEAFRMATNRPWWVSEVADGTRIDLAPVAVLEQRGGLEATIRLAVAELLVAGALAGRPVWVRVGAARYFSYFSPAAGSTPRPGSPRTPCPSDAELTLAVSAPAQREAEVRAEACFAREIQRVQDWRSVR